MRPVKNPAATGRPAGRWLDADDLRVAVDALETAADTCERRNAEEHTTCAHPDFAALAARLDDAAWQVPPAAPGEITTPEVATARGRALLSAYEAICGHPFDDVAQAAGGAAADLLHAAHAATGARPGEVMRTAALHAHEEITGIWGSADTFGYPSIRVQAVSDVAGEDHPEPLIVQVIWHEEITTVAAAAETTGLTEFVGGYDLPRDFPDGDLGEAMRSLWDRLTAGGPPGPVAALARRPARTPDEPLRVQPGGTVPPGLYERAVAAWRRWLDQPPAARRGEFSVSPGVLMVDLHLAVEAVQGPPARVAATAGEATRQLGEHPGTYRAVDADRWQACRQVITQVVGDLLAEADRTGVDPRWITAHAFADAHRAKALTDDDAPF